MKGLSFGNLGAKAPAQKSGRNGSDTPNKYEVFVRQPEVIVMLRRLPITDKKMKGSDYFYATARGLLYESLDTTKPLMSINGAAHGLNQVFAAGKIPFYARALGSRTVKIGRISGKFDPSKYATVEGHNLTHKADTTHFEQPRNGQPKRMVEWLSEIGIDFSVKPVDERQALAEIDKIADTIRIRDKKLYEDLEKDYLLRYTDEGEPLNPDNKPPAEQVVNQEDVNKEVDENGNANEDNDVKEAS